MNLYNPLERDFHQSLFVAPTIIAIVARMACEWEKITGYEDMEHIGTLSAFVED